MALFEFPNLVSMDAKSAVVENGVSDTESQVCALASRSKLVVAVKRKLHRESGKEPPLKMSVFWYKWGILFNETFCICEWKRPSTEQSLKLRWMKFLRMLFSLTLRKKKRQAVRQLSIPKVTVHKIKRNCLKLNSYKYKLLQQVIGQYKACCYTFCWGIC
jgi:hypothetical protein